MKSQERVKRYASLGLTATLGLLAGILIDGPEKPVRIKKVQLTTQTVHEVIRPQIHITYGDGTQETLYKRASAPSLTTEFTRDSTESLEHCLRYETAWSPCDPF